MEKTALAENRKMPSDAEQAFDRFLLLLGRLNYSWTNTESLLIHLIAGLSKTDKEIAVVVFLTLNTSRARLDLVQRLAKLPRISDDERDSVLRVTGRMMKLAGLRNRYNHCIYSFDARNGDLSTIQMRVSDRKKEIKVGEMTPIDASSISKIQTSLQDLTEVNHEVWHLIREYGYPC